LRYWRPVGFLRWTAASSPPSANRLRTRATVPAEHSNASAIGASAHPGPSGPASALSTMRAWVRAAVACRPPAIIASNRARWSAASLTTNLSFKAMAHLLP
jgi:hypothetical protein